jgi:archaemetzincin
VAGNLRDVDPELFPAPLVLPEDKLALDPECPPQSLLEWQEEEERNEVTPERKTIYIASPPLVEDDVSYVADWARCQSDGNEEVAKPAIEDVVAYVGAFYHGLQVRTLPASNLRFTSWDDSPPKAKPKAKGKTQSKSRTRKASTAPSYIALTTSAASAVRIRTRAGKDDCYKRQLNLLDLLDAAIDLLPTDAYALIMLIDHDMYESANDLFVAGRAYGGSRVAVVSTARYQPALDGEHSVNREHSWPWSHCAAYVRACCASPESPVTPKRSAQLSNNELASLYLARVCRTASHELGHCFGIDHCVYYACIMQGSASLAEDARQPPDLCAVDLAKVLSATGVSAKTRYQALAAVGKRFARRCEIEAKARGDTNAGFWGEYMRWLDRAMGKEVQTGQQAQGGESGRLGKRLKVAL